MPASIEGASHAPRPGRQRSTGAREPDARTLQEVVSLRLSRLKPAARELMQVAAVAAAPAAIAAASTAAM